MRRLCRWLLFLIGSTLVCLRLYPFERDDWVSQLFHDDFVYGQASSLSIRLIRESGLSLNLYASYADNLVTLAHATVVLLETVIIGVVFYIGVQRLK